MIEPGTFRRAVILSRGLGTRMRRADPGASLSGDQQEAASQGLKAMVPVGRPLVEYSLAALADAGFTEVCLVTGPEHQEARDRLDRIPLARLRLFHAIQSRPLGTADAVLAAREFTGSEEFAVLNGDNYYPPGALTALAGLAGPGLVAFTIQGLKDSGIPDERIAAYPAVAADAAGFLVHLGDLADRTPLTTVSMNCWRFSPAIHPACSAVSPSPRGELELPDAVALSMRQGERYRLAVSNEGVLDLSTRADIALVTARLAGREVRL